MKNIQTKFDFDDIIIVPNVTTRITSRYNDIVLPEILPLFTAPMDTVVGLDNIDNFYYLGINVALPRTVKYEEFVNYSKWKHYSNDVFISLGFDDLDKLERKSYRGLPPYTRILIDVANGHMEKIADYCQDIKCHRPDIIIMVGNIANPQTYTWYAEQNCVDYIRIGIGNGNGCLTTKQSGIGHPMASLIHEVYMEKQRLARINDSADFSNLRTTEEELQYRKKVKNLPYIVADGGMKDHSDIIKSLALGADYVMIGSIFNKAFESSADNYLYGFKLSKKRATYFFDKGYPVKKYFRGMSTKEAQKAMGKTKFKTSEGVVRFRKVEYHLSSWVENFEHYLRNAMSYANAKTLDEFVGKVEICQITKNGYDRFNK